MHQTAGLSGVRPVVHSLRFPHRPRPSVLTLQRLTTTLTTATTTACYYCRVILALLLLAHLLLCRVTLQLPLLLEPLQPLLLARVLTLRSRIAVGAATATITTIMVMIAIFAPTTTTFFVVTITPTNYYLLLLLLRLPSPVHCNGYSTNTSGAIITGTNIATVIASPTVPTTTTGTTASATTIVAHCCYCKGLGRSKMMRC